MIMEIPPFSSKVRLFRHAVYSSILAIHINRTSQFKELSLSNTIFYSHLLFPHYQAADDVGEIIEIHESGSVESEYIKNVSSRDEGEAAWL